MMKLGSALTLLVVSLMSVQALAINSKQLAKEQEQLYLKLKPNDPLRPTLALRLADLLFDASTEVDKTSNFSALEAKQMESARLKAIGLYQNALSGFNGQFAVPERASSLRIQFQLARLYVDQGLLAQADVLWEKLAAQNAEPRIQRESALRRAEKLEMATDASSLAAAKKYYDVALPSCGNKDLCSYIHYRRGWISHRLSDSDAGLVDLQKALELSDNSSSGEILRDMLLFISHSTWAPEKAVTFVEKLSVQYAKPDLLEKLTDAFFTADRRANYNYTLEYLNKKSPRIDRMIASLEFQYSERNSTKMKDLLSQLATANSTAFSAPDKKADVEKILYRLAVQWDGERERHPEYKEFFDKAALLYTRLYSNGPQYDKVVEGWLAAELNPDVKIAQLQTWADEQSLLKNKARALKMHKTRLAIAVKGAKTAIVVEESSSLSQVVADSKEKRELMYQQAHALYEQKEYDKALALFIPLSAPGKDKPDQTSIYSQNLALDILASQKRYDDIMIQAKYWTKNKSVQAQAERDSGLQKELNDMNAIYEKALFEKSSLTASAESLKNFTAFCMADKFLPKSCENAKTLSVQLKDQDTLIAILKKLDRKDELTSELEFGGHFVQAAQLLEPGLTSPKATLEDHLRVSMLFEIGGDYKNRDRILRGASAYVQKLKKPLSEQEEGLFYLTLKDVGMLGAQSLNLPWSEPRRLKLATELELAHQGNAQTQALLAKSCIDTGAPWHRIHLAELKVLNEKQKQIKFFGRQSQKHFQERIKALKTFAESTTCYLKGADLEHRYALLQAVSGAYAEMAQEIRSSPIPEGVEADMLDQVKAQIDEAAKPFDKQSQEWAVHAEEQLSKIAELQRPVVQKQYAAWNFEAPTADVAKQTVAPFNWGGLIERMKKNPFDNQTLADLEAHFKTHGQTRLAAYFEGRLSSKAAEKNTDGTRKE